MQKLHPEYIFPLCLLALSLVIFVIGAAQGSFGGGVAAVLILWLADSERQKAAKKIAKDSDQKEAE